MPEVIEVILLPSVQQHKATMYKKYQLNSFYYYWTMFILLLHFKNILSWIPYSELNSIFRSYTIGYNEFVHNIWSDWIWKPNQQNSAHINALQACPINRPRYQSYVISWYNCTVAWVRVPSIGRDMSAMWFHDITVQLPGSVAIIYCQGKSTYGRPSTESPNGWNW